MAKSRKVKVQIDFSRSWSWLLSLGILFVLLGLLGLRLAVGITLVSILFLGFIIVLAGIAQMIDVFKSNKWKHSVWHALIAFFYMIAGCLIIFDPVLTSTIVTLLIAVAFIMIGIIRVMMAFSLKANTRGWFFFFLSGLAAIILGTLIIMQWPLSGLWVIGLLISIELLIAGWAYIFIAFAMRNK